MKTNPMNPKNPAKPSVAKAIKIPTRGHNRADLQKINNPKTNQGSTELFKKGGDTMATKMKPDFMTKKKDGAKSAMPAALAKHASMPASKAHAGLKAGGMTKMGAVKTNARPDGVVQRGMTKGTQIKMKGAK